MLLIITWYISFINTKATFMYKTNLYNTLVARILRYISKDNIYKKSLLSLTHNKKLLRMAINNIK